MLLFNLLLNFPPVQTWLTHIAANYYSAKLHAKVIIGKVDFEFLKKLVLRDVYIQDRRHDTLFYTKDLKFDIGAFDFGKRKIIATDLIIDRPQLNLVTYKGEHELNLQFIINAFASNNTTSKSQGLKWDITVRNLEINNAAFRLVNQNDTATYSGMKLSDISVRKINLKASDIEMRGDTMQATLDYLSLLEQSGFELNKLSSYIMFYPGCAQLNALSVITPRSKLITDVVLRYQNNSEIKDFIHSASIEATFHQSQLCTDDLSYFIPDLKGADNCFTISGNYSGTINRLKGNNIDIGWGKQSHLQGEITVDGLPDLKTTRIKARISRLVTSKNDIEGLPMPPFNSRSHFKIPDNVARLGVVELTGSFDGLASDFKAEGTLSTSIGKISIALDLKQPGLYSDSLSGKNALPRYNGIIQTEAFDMGKFLQIKDLLTITSTLTFQGEGLQKQNAEVKLKGAVPNLSYRGYCYKDITMKGELHDGYFAGLLNVNDENLKMNFDGKIDMKTPIHNYHFNTHIISADLHKLGLIHDTIGQALLSAHLKVDMKGNTIENMNGTIHADSAYYAFHHSRYHLNFLDLKSSHDKDSKYSVVITSDYANALFSGNFAVINLPHCIKNILALYLPARFGERKPQKENSEKEQFDFKIKFNENTGLTTLFAPLLKVSEGTQLEGKYTGSNDKLSLNGKSRMVEVGGRKLKRWNLELTGDKSKIRFNTGCDTLSLADSIFAKKVTLNGTAGNDTISYSLKWNNDSSNFADIPSVLAFKNSSKTFFRFVKPVIMLNDSIWQVGQQNLVILDSSGISVQNLVFSHNNQSISVQKDNALTLALHRLNLNDFRITGITSIAGTLDGTLSSGNLTEAHPLFTGSLNMNNLHFNNQNLGNGAINCYWNNEDEAIAVNGQIIKEDTTLVSFQGEYYLRDSNNLNLNATLYQFPIKIFEPYINDVFSDISATASGNVQLTGTSEHPVLYGNVSANIARVKLNYLNTTNQVPDAEVKISPDTIRILPTVVLDKKEDTATVTGMITHNDFKDIALNLNVNAANFMCLNTTEDLNDLYFGLGFATGTANIYGQLTNIHVDANISTAPGTQFNIPLTSASEADQGTFIKFINKDTVKKKQNIFKVEHGGFEMNLLVHVTKDATTHLIFDKKDGDELIGSGTGNLQVSMTPSTDLSIMGDYTIEDGDYLLMLKGMLNKHFILEQGGTIKWSGDPYNADIDLRAAYHVSTSLEPFFPDDQTGIYKKNFPVNCELLLSGKLKSPQPTFKIQLPSVDESTRDIVDGYLSTTDELNTEAFSLLLLQEFQPPPQLSTGGSSGNGSASAGQLAQVSAYELMSNQLSHLLSGINNKFNVGVEFQPQTVATNQELKATFQSQIFNDRITITGDAGTQTTPQLGQTTAQSANNFVGEVTVDYRVTKNVHLKAFNRANDNTLTLTNSPYIQGAGISYREGFNTFGELWDKIKNKFRHHPKQKENTAAPK